MSTERCATACGLSRLIGIQNGTTCSCGGDEAHIHPLGDAVCNTPCSGSSRFSTLDTPCLGEQDTSVYRNLNPYFKNPSVPKKVTYLPLGCFAQADFHNMFEDYSFFYMPESTVQTCEDICAGSCYFVCGDVMDSAARVANASFCSTPSLEMHLEHVVLKDNITVFTIL